MNMEDKEILEEFCYSRNIKKATYQNYECALNTYCDVNNLDFSTMLKEAEVEEEEGVRWKHRKLKKRLIKYRVYLYNNYLLSTGKLYFARILTLYKHFEIEIYSLPPISEKNVRKSRPLNHDDLPTKDIIQKALDVASIIERSIILFMSSSGCARRETLNLTIRDLIEGTTDYHNNEGLKEVINTLNKQDNVIPTLRIHRQKTNKDYFTFCSPEATKTITNYLIYRGLDNLTLDDPVFDINERYFNYAFRKINNKLNLGTINAAGKFRSHMLRKFHASQLLNNGMSMDTVNSLQGRSKGVTNESYFMEDPVVLKDDYIKHLDCLCVTGFVNGELDSIYSRVQRLESIISECGFSDDELCKLKKLF